MDRIIVIGGSAGCLPHLRHIAAHLPRDLAAPVVIVTHMSPQAPSMLAEILSRDSELPVAVARTGALPERGHIFVARPDHHVLILNGRLSLSQGPKVNRTRPAIDVLFRSVAREYGPGAIGVLLSGYLDDGAAGLGAIKDVGGTVVVQDPATAMPPEMPMNALLSVEADHIVSAEAMPALLAELAGSPASRGQAPMTSNGEREDGNLTLSCPACGGVLRELHTGGVPAFRCRVGHEYGGETLLDAQADVIEAALWSAIRALEEQAMMQDRLAHRFEARNEPSIANRHRRRGAAALKEAASIRAILDHRIEAEV